MGTNKRYARQIDARMDAKILRMAAEGKKPDTLLAEELQLDRLPLTRTPVPKRVRAWVRYGSTPFEVDAEMVAWTPRAAAIRWTIGDEQHRAWVWGSAVRELSDAEGA
ncbi:hypothetical protein PYV02_01560 [Leifsonia sp. H3M29-4]|uniref:hypothetical protein n=1 Tax=Salinibacterium metalliresistens TaxID=3031321 RepID=UPI0023DA4110|nr:hypothetical protein [Salinibacterium metalliresistens]MDF1477766.1 hypothetical protein [Salinibacterium metalliresistens]